MTWLMGKRLEIPLDKQVAADQPALFTGASLERRKA